MTDDEYERLIRNLYVSHKRKLIEERWLCILFAIAVILMISFIGAFISTIIKIVQ